MLSHFLTNVMPQGDCYLCALDIPWLTVASDVVIIVACFSIALALFTCAKNHPEFTRDTPLILGVFAVVGVGLMHVIALWNLWQGDAGLQAISLSFTAIVALLTAIGVWRYMPAALMLRSRAVRSRALSSQAVFASEKAQLEKGFEQTKQQLELEKVTLLHNNQKLVKVLERRNQELHKAHNALIKTNQEVKNHSQKLIESNEELQQFAYIASHDLKAPLRNITGFLNILAKKYHDQLDTAAQELIDRTLVSADKMQTLINDLLKFSRVETKEEVFKTHHLDAIIKDVLFALDSDIKEQQVKITQHALPTLPVDRSQMIQLFSNLIGNAIKYGQKEAPHIQINAVEKANTWDICVQDNGIGIEEKYFEKIFEIFTRLHSDKEFAGTGIGLAICKRVVQRHKGSIRVESTKGVGSTFTISLPKALAGI